MLTELENGLGLDIVLWLQAHSNSGFDLLAEILDALGSSLFYMVFIPIFYWSVDKQLGRRLLLGLLLASASAIILKLVLKTPRPYIAHPDDVHPLFDEGTYGMPSGHAANAAAISGILALWVKKWGFTVLMIVYVILMGWSRMVAGVHYPQDVLVGILLGSIVVLLIHNFSNHFVLYWQQLSLRNKLGILLLLSAALVLILWNDEDGMKVTAVLAGGGIGMILDDYHLQFTALGSKTSRIVRYGIGILTVLFIFLAMRILFGQLNPEPLFLLIRYGVIGLVVAWLYPWFFSRTQANHT